MPSPLVGSLYTTYAAPSQDVWQVKNNIGTVLGWIDAAGNLQGTFQLAGVLSQQNLTPVGSPAFSISTSISVLSITLSGNVTSSTFSSSVAAPAFVLFVIKQDGAGSHTFAWPASFNNTTSIGSAANQTTIQLFYWDGTNAWGVTSGTVYP